MGKLIRNRIEYTGGSGSGGHTIVDDAGTDLTQRTNLQFKGAYSEDNSTDDTTEVNVVREMTKAEFDLLSDDEKVGFINITDITGGNDDRFQPVVYSEEEREIGVWTDGRLVYERTYNPTVTSADQTFAHGISNLGTVVSITGMCTYNNQVEWLSLPYVSTSSSYCITLSNVTSTTFRLIRGSGFSSIQNLYVTIQYTKTTDTPGSGQWTPQGVPAVHYSTDEQVIGIWIDGSTLYEKTYVFQNVSSSVNAWTTLSTLTGIAKVVDIEGFMDYHREVRTFGIGMYLNVSFANGVLQYYTKELPGGTCDITVTIRYTKSS